MSSLEVAVSEVKRAVSGTRMQLDVLKIVNRLGTSAPRVSVPGSAVAPRLWAALPHGSSVSACAHMGTGAAHGEIEDQDGFPIAIVVVTANCVSAEQLDLLYQGAIDYTLARRANADTDRFFIRVLRDPNAEAGLPAAWTAEAVSF